MATTAPNTMIDFQKFLVHRRDLRPERPDLAELGRQARRDHQKRVMEACTENHILSVFLQSVWQPVLILDQQGDLLFANEKGSSFLTLDAVPLSPSAFLQSVVCRGPNQKIIAFLDLPPAQTLQDGKSHTLSFWVERPDQSKQYIEMHTFPIFDPQNEERVQAAIVTWREAHERRREEAG